MSFTQDSEPVNFRTEEKPSTRVAVQEPQCMRDLPKETPSRPALNEEQTTQAKQELVNKEYVNLAFPKTMRLHVDPVLNGQLYTLVSFIPSKDASPDKDGCFGVLKVRGSFNTVDQADSWADNIIRNHDSYTAIDYCLVGRPFPLMVNNELYRLATKEVDVRKKVDDTIKHDIKKKRVEEQKEMESIQERHRQLMRDVSEDKEQAIDDLEYYVQLKTKKASLMYNVQEIRRKEKESLELVDKVSEEIRDIDKKFPNYKDEFLDRYTKALETQGIDVSKNPLIQFMRD
jgi:hypothetical protein